MKPLLNILHLIGKGVVPVTITSQLWLIEFMHCVELRSFYCSCYELMSQIRGTCDCIRAEMVENLYEHNSS